MKNNLKYCKDFVTKTKPGLMVVLMTVLLVYYYRQNNLTNLLLCSLYWRKTYFVVVRRNLKWTIIGDDLLINIDIFHYGATSDYLAIGQRKRFCVAWYWNTTLQNKNFSKYLQVQYSTLHHHTHCDNFTLFVVANAAGTFQRN